jgi:hypothetical protein
LEKIKEGIETIGDYLMGIDAYLYEYGKFVSTYVKEIEDSYNYEYDHQYNYYYS